MLIQGASSGVGLMGMQIGKLMGASIVMGTSTNAGTARAAQGVRLRPRDRLQRSEMAGRGEEGHRRQGRRPDRRHGVGAVANQNLEAACDPRPHRQCRPARRQKGEFNFDLHALKRIDYIGVTFRTRTPEEVREIVQLMRADLWPAVEAGKLSLPIDKTFPLEKVAEALAMMKANQHFGKIVLTM